MITLMISQELINFHQKSARLCSRVASSFTGRTMDGGSACFLAIKITHFFREKKTLVCIISCAKGNQTPVRDCMLTA